MTPTTTSATNLLRDGTVTQQLIGGCSITAQVLGMGLVAVFLHPTHFGARWNSKWVDGPESGYVNHYGMLFKDYREGRHWFIAAELLMSMATGVIKSYLTTSGNCRDVVTAAAATSLAYALSMGLLRPNLNPKERIFYGAIASIEALALSMQAIAYWAGSEETRKKTRAAAESIVMVAEWSLFAKSIFDIGNRIKSIYHYFKSNSHVHQLFQTLREEEMQQPLLDEVPRVNTPAPEVPSRESLDSFDEILAGPPALDASRASTPLLPSPREGTPVGGAYTNANPENLNPLGEQRPFSLTIEEQVSLL
jgi:hypothetical protein